MKHRLSYGKPADRALALWVKLARASSTFGRLTQRHIHSFGLTEPQFAVIECLGHLGPLTLGDLSRKMLVSGGNITCVAGHLERDGLVERVRSPGDRRKTVARLTPKGRRLFAATFRKHAAYVGEIASVLDAREQEELSVLLRKLGLALAGTNGRPDGRLNGRGGGGSNGRGAGGTAGRRWNGRRTTGIETTTNNPTTSTITSGRKQRS